MERDVLIREIAAELGPHPTFEFGIETVLEAVERLGYTIVRAEQPSTYYMAASVQEMADPYRRAAGAADG